MTFDDFKQKVGVWENTTDDNRDSDKFVVEIQNDSSILKEWGGEIVEDFGGEGKGDTVRIVVHFKEGDLYVKAEGYYASYDGSDWSSSEWEEVRPKEKTITVYE